MDKTIQFIRELNVRLIQEANNFTWIIHLIQLIRCWYRYVVIRASVYAHNIHCI